MLTAAASAVCRRPSRSPRRRPAPGRITSAGGSRFAVGMSSSRPRRSPSTTGPTTLYGAPSSSAAPRHVALRQQVPDPARRDRVAALLDQLHDLGLELRPGRSSGRVAGRAVAEAEVRADAHRPRAQRAGQHLLAEVLGRLARELGGERNRDQLVHAELGDERRSSDRVVVRSCGGCSGRRTRSGCGSNVTTVGDEPALAGALDGGADHPPVAAGGPRRRCRARRRGRRPSAGTSASDL